jgi:hypothetical protein
METETKRKLEPRNPEEMIRSLSSSVTGLLQQIEVARAQMMTICVLQGWSAEDANKIIGENFFREE